MKYMSDHKPLMLSLAGSLLRRFRIARAKRRFLERIRDAPDRGTRGVIRWTRDELHER